uniref:Methenyltetrahydrofolate synthase domain-containing protein n=1 Tax=Microcebus murinus TaxID=30608 RepID=A0A8C5VTS1_MICMU
MEPRAGVSKQDIREQIWDYMESQNLADFPRPVHHRIPNFKVLTEAPLDIKDLDVFARAQEVKVDPDKPLEGVRLLALQSKKTLLVPTPRLENGGVRSYSTPIGLDSSVLVDVVVVGSVAVSEKGWRIGKGEGYADLEYAMMVSMGAVGEETPVVTIVHDCQVVDIPEALVGGPRHHSPVLATGCERPKPTGITWSKISCEMMEKIPVLRRLRERERQAGKDVALQDEPRHPSGHQKAPPGTVTSPQDVPGLEDSVGAARGSPQGEGAPLAADVYVGNLPRDARVSDLKRALRELGVAPLRLTWQGPRRRAFLHYQDPASAQQALSCLQGLRLGPDSLRVALARQQRDK